MKTGPAVHCASMVSCRRVIDRLRLRNLLPIVEHVCRARGVTLDELCGRIRTRNVSHARHEAWWLLRQHPEYCFSLPEIGRLFGRDHTTVKAGIDEHRCRRQRQSRGSTPVQEGR